MKKERIREYQERVLRSLSGKIGGFYLAGGTALSLFYFQHRLSIDLDFFTKDFSSKKIKDIVSYLQERLEKKIELVGQNLGEKSAKIFVYNICFTAKDVLKIDFVEDVIELLRPTKEVEGIKVLSLEDIYLRKLYAVCGAISSVDVVGRNETLGGRIEAKDFYDLYFLSNTFMSLSRFIEKYGNSVMIEGLIKWFRSYDRVTMIDGVLTLDVDKKMDYRKMEAHFKKEIDKIIESQLGEL